MSKRITLTLTDSEHADLEARATAERRSVRDMAAYLVTKPQGWTFTPDLTWRPGLPGLWPPQVTCGTTDATGTNDHVLRNTPIVTLASSTDLLIGGSPDA